MVSQAQHDILLCHAEPVEADPLMTVSVSLASRHREAF